MVEIPTQIVFNMAPIKSFVFMALAFCAFMWAYRKASKFLNKS